MANTFARILISGLPVFFLPVSLSISLDPKWRIEESHTEPLATFSMILTLVFLVEVIMKNIAFTPRGYWQSRRNRYDLLVTVVGVIWIVIHCTMKVRQVRTRSRRSPFYPCPSLPPAQNPWYFLRNDSTVTFRTICPT